MLQDGASDDWMYANLQSELASVTLAEAMQIEEPAVNDERWQALLQDHESVVCTSVVDKRKGFFSIKRRRLLLTTKPRLFYVHPVSFELKGIFSVFWQHTVRGILKRACV